MEFISNLFDQLQNFETTTKVYGLMVLVTLLILLWFGLTLFLSKKFGKNAKLKAIPGGYSLKVHQPEFQASIKELLAQHGLSIAQDLVTKKINHKIARLNTGILKCQPKEIVEAFFTGNFPETKRLLIEHVATAQNKEDYFWAIADLCYIELDFNTALFYMDQALKVQPDDKDLKKDMIDLIDLWESRTKVAEQEA